MKWYKGIEGEIEFQLYSLCISAVLLGLLSFVLLCSFVSVAVVPTPTASVPRTEGCKDGKEKAEKLTEGF